MDRSEVRTDFFFRGRQQLIILSHLLSCIRQILTGSVISDLLSDLTVGFQEFVDVGQELQQPVEVVLGGAALQHREEQHGGLALHPLQGESTGGCWASASQLYQQ